MGPLSRFVSVFVFTSVGKIPHILEQLSEPIDPIFCAVMFICARFSFNTYRLMLMLIFLSALSEGKQCFERDCYELKMFLGKIIVYSLKILNKEADVCDQI